MWNIEIFCKENIQNRLLCNFLSSSLKITVSINKSRQYINLYDGKNLLMIDYDGKYCDDIIQDILTNSSATTYLVLFNVQEDANILEYLVLPELVGVFLCGTNESEFVVGIKEIMEGKIWMPPVYVTAYFNNTRSSSIDKTPIMKMDYNLTQREKEILGMLCAGARNQVIAKQLNISLYTVKTHLYRIFRKLEVNSRLEAVSLLREVRLDS